MKECPACHNLIQDRLVVCPQCGYAFDSEPGDAAKKTMMGIPGLDLTSSLNAADTSSQGAGRTTMFGFPINDIVEESEVHEQEYDATQVVDTGSIEGIELELPSEGRPSLVSQSGFELGARFDAGNSIRSTMGGIPSISGRRPTEEDSEHEEEGGQATVVASSALFNLDAEEEQPQGFSKVGAPTMHERPKRHETLMGMTLDDLAPSSVKQTLFSIPSHGSDGPGEGLSEASESEPDELPTQAISGVSFNEDPQDMTREQNRQRLLDKLRANTKNAQEERPTRSTMFGIPAITQEETLDEEEDNNELSDRMTPNTGVLKVARRPSNATTQGRPPESTSNSAVLGKSSYMVSKEDDAGSKSSSRPASSPLPSLSASLRLQQQQRASEPLSEPSLDEPSVAEHTRVAGDLLTEEQLELMESSQFGPATQSPTRVAQSDLLESLSLPDLSFDGMNADMTREQSLDSLHAQLRSTLSREDSSEATLEAPEARPANTRQHFSDDATRQHDVDSLRSQFGSELFPEKKPNLDATAVAPALVPPRPAPTPEPRPASTGPMFAVPHSTPRMELPEPEPLPEIALSPELPQLEEDSLLEPEPLDLEPYQPAPPVAHINLDQAALFDSPPQEEIEDLPLIDAMPLPVEPSYKTVTSTSTPTPPHGTQVPAQQPAPVSTGRDVGRVFQVIFALLGVISLVCATAAPLIAPAAEPLGPIVYAPAAIALLVLLGALIPSSKGRVALLLLAMIGCIGVFAFGILTSLPILTSILALVGGLFCLTAMAFPLFARSL